ncbi:MAG: CsiV family protein [Pseudomonadota bacterium]
MYRFKFLFFAVFLIFSQSVLAASWYQVEVVVFDRLYPNLDGEQWQNEEFIMRDNLVELEPASAEEFIPYKVLNKSRNRLAGVYRVMKLSSEYRPLYHVSWQQVATERRKSRYVHIQRLEGGSVIPVAKGAEEEPEFLDELIQPDRIIDGSIRIRSGFYLHADIDLSYFKKLPPENMVLRTSEESYSGFDKTVIKLKETRKIKLNEIHYFDHPMFGVVLQVSRLSIPNS